MGTDIISELSLQTMSSEYGWKVWRTSRQLFRTVMCKMSDRLLHGSSAHKRLQNAINGYNSTASAHSQCHNCVCAWICGQHHRRRNFLKSTETNFPDIICMQIPGAGENTLFWWTIIITAEGYSWHLLRAMCPLLFTKLNQKITCCFLQYQTPIDSYILYGSTQKQDCLPVSSILYAYHLWLLGGVVASVLDSWSGGHGLAGSTPGHGIVGQRPWASCSHQCASVYQAV